MSARLPSRRRRPQWEELDDEALEQLRAAEAERRQAAGEVYDSEDELDSQQRKGGVAAEDEELDSGGESDQEGGRRARKRQSTRDGEMIASARLRHQGIQAEGDVRFDDEDEDDGEEYDGIKGDGDKKTAKLNAVPGSGRRQQHSLEHVFGRAADTLPMERFSLREDQTERDTVTDAWLESVQPKENSSASSSLADAKSGDAGGENGNAEEDEFDRRQRLQKEERLRRRRQQEQASAINGTNASNSSDNNDSPPPSQVTLLGRLIGLLEAGETIPQALRRLGKTGNHATAAGVSGGTAKKPQGFKKIVADADAAAASHGTQGGPQETPQQAEQRQLRLATLTDLSADLVKLGMMNIYDKERETLVRTFQSMQESQRRQAEAERRAAAVQRMPSWEYRWAVDDPEVHGPFAGDRMNEWRHHFDSALVRLVQPGSPPGPWRPAREFQDFRIPPLAVEAESSCSSRNNANRQRMKDDADEDYSEDDHDVKDGMVSSSSSAPAPSPSSRSSSLSSSSKVPPSGRKRSAAAVTAPPQGSDEEDIFDLGDSGGEKQDSKRLRR